MTRHAWLATGLLAAGSLSLLAGPASATSCAERMTKVDGLVKEQSKESISASTGGQADAGSRAGQGVSGSGANANATSGPAPEKSAEAGKGGDRAMQAKVALDEARTAQGKGDEQGCMDALGRAQKLLATAP